MMDCTDRHDRYFLRLISKNVMLYSEMVATKSAIHGDRKRILGFREEEKPVALQVGGSDKNELAEVAKLAEQFGYDEININLGCPSKKVQKNSFGACLMKEPDLVAECINKIKQSGCKTVILHARKALLKGLTPKQNLNIPKLNYKMVYEIKKANPELEIIINGGVSQTEQIKKHLEHCDGVMIGRAIYQNPYFLTDIEKEIFNTNEVPSREQIAKQIISYLEEEVKLGTKVNHVMRHTVGLYHGQPGSKDWKRYLSDNMMARDSDFQKAKHIMTIVQNNEKANQLNS